jgi:hypothetical protein
MKNWQNQGYFSVLHDIMLDDKNICVKAWWLYGKIAGISAGSEKGYCKSSNDTLARDLRTGKTSIQRWINELVAGGYIKREIIYAADEKTVLERRLTPTGDMSKKFLPCAVPTPYPKIDTPNSKDSTALTPKEIPPHPKNGAENIINSIDKNFNNIPPISPKRGKRERKVFKKPSLLEIEEFCKERGNDVDAVTFFNHYESRGWKSGKTKITDWQATVRTWEDNARAKQQAEIKKEPKLDNIKLEKRAFSIINNRRATAEDNAERLIKTLSRNATFVMLGSKLNALKFKALTKPNLKTEIAEMQEELDDWLCGQGIDPSKLTPQYHCALCKDTGMSGVKNCECVEKIIEELKKETN